MLKILEIGDYLTPGLYTIHSEFKRAVNYQSACSDRMLSLVSHEVGGGPYNMVVEHLDNYPREVELTKEYLEAGEIKRSNSLLSEEVSKISGDKLKCFGELLLENQDVSYLIGKLSNECQLATFDSHLKNRLLEGKHAIFEVDLLEGIKMLRGLGVGLTPSGDDFLIGMMIGIHLKAINTRQTDFLRDKILGLILKNSLGKNELSNWFLKTAFRGLVSSKMRTLIDAFSNGSIADFKEAFKEQALIGHSSGLDQLVGLYEVVRREFPWPTLLNL